MCGRYTLAQSLQNILSWFGIAHCAIEFRERFNIAPTQTAPVIIAGEAGPELLAMRWGIAPPWAGASAPLINARAETLGEKPVFSRLLPTRRALVPADGFIEWQRRGKVKLPRLFFLKNQPLFAMAALWDGQLGGPERAGAFVIITAAANSLVGRLHTRMPVILPRADYAAWLRPGSAAAELPPLRPLGAELMDSRALPLRVNSPRHDDPECLAPAGEEAFD